MAWNSVRHLSTEVDATASGRTVVAVTEAILVAAEVQIDGCARCDTSSDVAFGSMLRCFLTDRSSGSLAMERSAKCPNCSTELTEQSLVSWD